MEAAKYDIAIFLKSGNHLVINNVDESGMLHWKAAGEVLCGIKEIDVAFIENGGYSFKYQGEIASEEYFNPNNIEVIKVYKQTEYYKTNIKPHLVKG